MASEALGCDELPIEPQEEMMEQPYSVIRDLEVRYGPLHAVPRR